MSVEETYKRTRNAETYNNEFDDDTSCSMYDNKSQYSLSNDEIQDIYTRVVNVSKRKHLTEEQMQDAFCVELVDHGMDSDSADEVCELYVRTEGELFASSDDEEDDDPDMPPLDDDEEGVESDEEELGDDRSDTEIFEV